jgi:hypothetical protein
MKNSNDTIGNRTRNLPTCSAVPQPTTSPRAPGSIGNVLLLCHAGYFYAQTRRFLYSILKSITTQDNIEDSRCFHWKIQVL